MDSASLMKAHAVAFQKSGVRSRLFEHGSHTCDDHKGNRFVECSPGIVRIADMKIAATKSWAHLGGLILCFADALIRGENPAQLPYLLSFELFDLQKRFAR